jgi:arginine/lysine/ornithine decarboxylase
VLSDIRSIAGICHAHGIPLIVDEAHGAHLKFLKSGSFTGESALDAGADIVIQSAHKNLPALTQSASIHVGRESGIDTVRLSEQLGIYESSSPSYILMASLDEAVDILLKEGDMLFGRLSGNIEKLDKELSGLKSLRAFIFKKDEEGVYGKDPTRIMIDSGSTGLSGEALAELLRKEYRIETEMSAGRNVLAVATIGDTEEGFERFRDALLTIDKDMYNKADIIQRASEPLPLARLLKGCADSENPDYAASCDSDYEFVDTLASEGRLCGEFITLSPPGIPLLIPGERITREAAYLLSDMEDEAIRSRSEGQKGRIAVIK